jgi:nucleotide sugar dehydrogenase
MVGAMAKDALSVLVIGLGEVGLATYTELEKKSHAIRSRERRLSLMGYDCNPERVKYLKDNKIGASWTGTLVDSIVPARVYIIDVYTTRQVIEVCNKIREIHPIMSIRSPTIIIESTVDPGTYNKILNLKWKEKPNIVLCPHRYNPGDPDHYVFNLTRVFGSDSHDGTADLCEIFGEDATNLVQVDMEIAELCKPMENAYRFMEIVLAQEMAKMCEQKGISFAVLRKAMNTKWNIDVKEARDGVGGKCLPKDMLICAEYFDSDFMRKILALNELYKNQAGH